LKSSAADILSTNT